MRATTSLHTPSPETTQPWYLNGRCLEGTIPIGRTKEEDLLRAGSAANYGRKKHHSILSTDSAGITHEVIFNF